MLTANLDYLITSHFEPINYADVSSCVDFFSIKRTAGSHFTARFCKFNYANEINH